MADTHIKGESDYMSWDTPVTFGKYAAEGKTLGELPASYLLYLYERRILFGKFRNFVTEHMDELLEREKKEKRYKPEIKKQHDDYEFEL